MIVVFLSLLFGRAGAYRALTPTGVFGNRNARRPTELLSLSGHDRGENEHVSPRVLKARNLNNPIPSDRRERGVG